MNWMSVELKITLRETGENGDLIWFNNSHKIFTFNELNTVQVHDSDCDDNENDDSSDRDDKINTALNMLAISETRWIV
jgi:hypothetical protein